jgi:FkbM family methyltransferase
MRGIMHLDTARKLLQQYPLLRVLLFPVQRMRARVYRKKKALQKDVVRNLRSVLVSDPLVSVEEFQGSFSIDRRSDIFERIAIDGIYEPDLVRDCKQYLDRDKDVLDIGANIGFYTVMFAKNINGRRVLAVEPTRNALERLRKNIALNRVEDRVIVFEGAVSDRAGKATIRVVPGKEEYSSVGVMEHPSILEEQHVSEEVESITVDELVARHDLHPGFMKVDVEGGEHLVFSGAKNVLSTCRPVILSELSDFLLTKNGSSSMDVINLIRQYDYDVLDPRDPSGPLGEKAFGDIICLPKETGIAREIQAAVA